MRNRFNDAHEIWHNGASNPRGVARSLVDAIDAAVDAAVEEGHGSKAACDAAEQMILDHLCFLCGLPQPSLDLSGAEWLDIEKCVEDGRPTS